MCFAPQRRALFRHLNFQKWSEPGVFCTFWLGNVLRATTACTFSTSQLEKVVRTPGVFNILTSKCASRHNGVHFFISHLASWLRTRRFSEPTFRPSRATNHWKNTVFRDFPTFSRICIFFLLTLSLLLFFLLIFLFSLPLPCSAFHLSILSEVWLLNFLRWWNVSEGCITLSKTLIGDFLVFWEYHEITSRGPEALWRAPPCVPVRLLCTPCLASAWFTFFERPESASLQCKWLTLALNSCPGNIQVGEPSQKELWAGSGFHMAHEHLPWPCPINLSMFPSGWIHQAPQLSRSWTGIWRHRREV